MISHLLYKSLFLRFPNLVETKTVNLQILRKGNTLNEHAGNITCRILALNVLKTRRFTIVWVRVTRFVGEYCMQGKQRNRKEYLISENP